MGRRLTDQGRLVAAGTVLLLTALVGAPLVEMLRSALIPGGRPTLGPARSAFAVDGFWRLCGTTAGFAVGAAAVAVAVGGGLAVVVCRTDTPGRRAIAILVLAPLAVPGVVYALAWVALAGPRSGLVNDAFAHLAGVRPLDPFGFGGMTVVEGLHLAPVAFLLVAAALAGVDPDLEDLAVASGAGQAAVLRRVTLPLARRALMGAALLVLIAALEGFEIPALLGVPGGRWVLATRVWRAMSAYPGGPAQAGAYALVLLAATVAVLGAHRVVVGGHPSRTPLSGRVRPRRTGRWRAPVAAAAWGLVAVTTVLPLAALMRTSLDTTFGAGHVTLANYQTALRDPRVIVNTLLLAVVAATLTVGMGAAIGMTERRRSGSGGVLVGVATLPLAVPGIVLGAALAAIWIGAPVAIYGTLWLLVIAAVVRGLPLAARFASEAVGRVPTEMEELARGSGASPAHSARRVVLPLARPGLIAAWLIVAAATIRELGGLLLLVSPGDETVAVRVWEAYFDGRFGLAAAFGVVLVVLLGALATLAWRALPTEARA